MKTEADYEAFRSAAGGWKHVDTDKLIADIYAGRALGDRSEIGRRSDVHDQELIERYIDPEWDRYPHGRADARLKGYGVSVWALIGQLEAIGGDLDQLAIDYDLPRVAVDAALAYYRRNKKYIDARLLLNGA